MLLGGVIIGALGGYASVGFVKLLDLIQHLVWKDQLSPRQLMDVVSWHWIILLPALGILLTVLFLRYFAPESAGPGVPQVMEANVINGGVIHPKAGVAKTIGSALTIGFGGSVGREGPMVFIGSAIGSLFGQFTQVSSRKLKTFVGCGAASGIAATFNAPIAGALFAVEIIIGDFGVAQFGPIVVASVVATMISHFYLGNSHVFDLQQYIPMQGWEFVSYSVLGLAAGMVAILFMKTLFKMQDEFEQIQIPFYIKAVIGGITVGVMGLILPYVLGNGYPSISLALNSELVWWVALILVFWKILATSLTINSGGSGGIFAPSIFIGAMTGLAVGQLIQILFPSVEIMPGAYALVGMAGVVGAGTHAPLTAILMIIELTNEYQIILPVMLTTTIATVFARILSKESIYTTALVRKGLDVEGGRDINVLRSLPVKSAMRTTLEKVSQNTTLSHLMDLMSVSQHSVFFITSREEKIIGYVTLNDLRKLIRDAEVLSHLVIAGDIAHPIQFSLHEDDSLDQAMGLFAQEGIDELPVLTSDDAECPSATLWRQDVIETYNREIFRRDMASELAEKIVSHDLTPQPVQIVAGFSILEREVPKFLIGKTIRGSHIREQYGIEIILVKSENKITGKTEETMPSAGYRLRSEDSILIFGETVKIRHFASL